MASHSTVAARTRTRLSARPKSDQEARSAVEVAKASAGVLQSNNWQRGSDKYVLTASPCACQQVGGTNEHRNIF
jgi:hypothetical protein